MIVLRKESLLPCVAWRVRAYALTLFETISVDGNKNTQNNTKCKLCFFCLLKTHCLLNTIALIINVVVICCRHKTTDLLLKKFDFDYDLNMGYTR